MIIIFGIDVNGVKTVFYDGDNVNDIVKRAHVLKHSHGRYVIGAFDKFYMKDIFGTVIDMLYCLSSINQYLSTMCIMVQDFMTNIYNQKYIYIYILMMTGVVFLPNKKLERYTIQNINILIKINIML